MKNAIAGVAIEKFFKLKLKICSYLANDNREQKV